MTDPLILQSPPLLSRDEQIRDLFTRQGGGKSTRMFAVAVREAGIYTPEQLDSFNLQIIQIHVRQALKHMNGQGLPFAGQTMDKDATGHAVWKQRELWKDADYGLNVGELADQITTGRTHAQNLVTECLVRYPHYQFDAKVLASIGWTP